MKHYLKIFIKTGEISLQNLFEYRADLVVVSIFKLIESITAFIIVFITADLTKEISGWNVPELLLISLTFSLSTGLISFLFMPGLKYFEENLNWGNIDGYLVKPLDVQFHASLSNWDWTQIFRIAGSVIGITWVISKYNLSINLFSSIEYFTLVAISSLLLYLIVFLSIIFILMAGRINNADYLAVLLWEPGRWPTTIFNDLLKIFFAVLIPLFFAATVPVGVLTGKYNHFYLLAGSALTVSFIFISRKILTLGLKKYSGAGT